jgi:TRAP-type C4-dicarboxylate transport system substrate-binding protein
MTKLSHLLCALGLMACVATTSSVAAAPISLRFADSFPLSHDLSKEGMVYWMKRAEQLSNGAVTFTHYPAEQLVKARALFGAVSSGTIDVGYIANGYFTDKLPLNGVADIPGEVSSSKRGSKAYWSLLNEEGRLRSEFLAGKVMPMAFIVMPPYQMVLRSGKIDSLDKLRGLKIRSGGGIQNLTIEAVGATPVAMAAPDTYLGIQRGTLDGTLLAAISLKPYKLHEVSKSITQNIPFGSPAIGIGMNLDKFNGLPEDVRKALVQAGHDTVAHLSRYLDDQIAKAEAELTAAGMTVYTPPEATLTQIQEKLGLVAEDWAKRIRDRGLPADEVLTKFRDHLKASQ